MDEALRMTGILFKRGHRVHNWKERYFTVDDQCVLEYFEDELSSVAKGEINVAGAEIRAGFSVKDREDCFSVKALTGEELILQAPRHRESTGSGSLDAGELWVDHLRRIARMAILEQGVLQKMMSIRKKWKDRYCCLMGQSLYYYESESVFRSHGKPLGVIYMLNAIIEELSGKDAGNAKFALAVTASHTSKRVKLRCTTEDDYERWMAALLEATHSGIRKEAFAEYQAAVGSDSDSDHENGARRTAGTSSSEVSPTANGGAGGAGGVSSGTSGSGSSSSDSDGTDTDEALPPPPPGAPPGVDAAPMPAGDPDDEPKSAPPSDAEGATIAPVVHHAADGSSSSEDEPVAAVPSAPEEASQGKVLSATPSDSSSDEDEIDDRVASGPSSNGAPNSTAEPVHAGSGDSDSDDGAGGATYRRGERAPTHSAAAARAVLDDTDSEDDVEDVTARRGERVPTQSAAAARAVLDDTDSDEDVTDVTPRRSDRAPTQSAIAARAVLDETDSDDEEDVHRRSGRAPTQAAAAARAALDDIDSDDEEPAVATRRSGRAPTQSVAAARSALADSDDDDAEAADPLDSAGRGMSGDSAAEVAATHGTSTEAANSAETEFDGAEAAAAEAEKQKLAEEAAEAEAAEAEAAAAEAAAAQAAAAEAAAAEAAAAEAAAAEAAAAEAAAAEAAAAEAAAAEAAAAEAAAAEAAAAEAARKQQQEVEEAKRKQAEALQEELRAKQQAARAEEALAAAAAAAARETEEEQRRRDAEEEEQRAAEAKAAAAAEEASAAAAAADAAAATARRLSSIEPMVNSVVTTPDGSVAESSVPSDAEAATAGDEVASDGAQEAAAATAAAERAAAEAEAAAAAAAAADLERKAQAEAAERRRREQAEAEAAAAATLAEAQAAAAAAEAERVKAEEAARAAAARTLQALARGKAGRQRAAEARAQRDAARAAAAAAAAERARQELEREAAAHEAREAAEREAEEARAREAAAKEAARLEEERIAAAAAKRIDDEARQKHEAAATAALAAARADSDSSSDDDDEDFPWECDADESPRTGLNRKILKNLLKKASRGKGAGSLPSKTQKKLVKAAAALEARMYAAALTSSEYKNMDTFKERLASAMDGKLKDKRSGLAAGATTAEETRLAKPDSSTATQRAEDEGESAQDAARDAADGSHSDEHVDVDREAEAEVGQTASPDGVERGGYDGTSDSAEVVRAGAAAGKSGAGDRSGGEIEPLSTPSSGGASSSSSNIDDERRDAAAGGAGGAGSERPPSVGFAVAREAATSGSHSDDEDLDVFPQHTPDRARTAPASMRDTRGPALSPPQASPSSEERRLRSAMKPHARQAIIPPDAGERTWGGHGAEHPGNARVVHYPATSEGGLYVHLVMEKRPPRAPDLKRLSRWQHNACASCHRKISRGFFGRKGHYCNYLELLFCPSCFGDSVRPIPWRVVHNFDFRMLPVSEVAATFLDSVWRAPTLSIVTLNPELFWKDARLPLVQTKRQELCRLYTALPVELTKPILKRVLPRHRYLYTDEAALSLADMYAIHNGTLTHQIIVATEALEKLADAHPEAQAALAKLVEKEFLARSRELERAPARRSVSTAARSRSHGSGAGAGRGSARRAQSTARRTSRRVSFGAEEHSDGTTRRVVL